MDTFMVGIALRESQAIQIIDDLRDSGFQQDEISILAPERDNPCDSGAHDDIAGLAEPGGALGAALGWLAALATVKLTEEGEYIAAGPLLGALQGGMQGGVVGRGGVARALERMGASAWDAGRYEAEIRHGAILVAVRADGAGTSFAVRDVFKRNHAVHLCSAVSASGLSAQ